MIRGLYTAGSGMITQMDKMDVVSNNIANVNTTGFKKDMVVTQSFSEELMKRLNDQAIPFHLSAVNMGGFTHGVAVNQIATDFSKGNLVTTDNPYDLTIFGDGFFVIERGGETFLTKNGAFIKNEGGFLVTSNGDAVLGTDGPLFIGEGQMTMNKEGIITANGEEMGQILIQTAENLDDLRKHTDDLYRIIEGGNLIDSTGDLLQGILEASNVNPVAEMVEMIALNRAYEASQKVVTMLDGTMGQAANDIGKKG